MSNPTKPTLYICATPIGNLEDATFRLIDTLKKVDLIAAEDTRVTGHLLKHYDIKTRLISVHKHNESSRADLLREQLHAGQNIALVSDAGTPNVSDPGAKFLKKLIGEDINIVPIPGPSSLTTLLSIAPFEIPPVTFIGFLPKTPIARENLLKKHTSTPIACFESPHRILKTLSWFQEKYPPNQILIAKELTKSHEQIWHNLDTCIQELQTKPSRQRGEWIILLS